MPRLTLEELLLANLEGSLREGSRGWTDREETLRRLRALSGQDFGDDIDRWRVWLKRERPAIRRRRNEESERRAKRRAEEAKLPYGVRCANCGAETAVWADTGRGCCSRCGTPLPPSENETL